MKTVIPLVFLILLTSFNAPLEAPPIKTHKENFSWLLGGWQRSNEKEGKQTYEHWSQKSHTEYIGMGCTLKEGDTIWKENIILREVDKQWQFEVSGQGETQATIFKLTTISTSGFTCENPENEFPKIISYKKSSSGLRAEISGGGPHIVFEFKKIND